ncbi:MAG: asparagine synthase-related protein [Acidobacteriota bacterium]
MSGICGLLYRDRRPVAPETLNSMVAALAWLGPDGCSIWREGSVGLGHLLLRNTPESLHESHPVASDDGRLTLVSTTRIDNREELLEAFEVPRSEWGQTTDPWLCLRAYEKWGEAAPARILGDWAFALWDQREKKLFLARDQHGIPGIFYYASDRCFAFASSVKGLFAIPEIPVRLDQTAVAGSLVRRLPGDRTIWKGIRLLHGSNQISVTLDSVRKTRYYFLEQAPRLRLGSDEEYLEAFRDRFTEAIRCRLRHLRPACISLSGGLDSASIAAIAAQLVQPDHLRAFCAVPLFSAEAFLPRGRHADETPFVEAIAHKTPNLRVSYLRNRQDSPLEACLRASRLADQPNVVPNFLWILALRRQAQAEGLGVVLTGFGGNATISWYGHGTLLDNGNWHRPLRMFDEFQRWRKKDNLPFLRALLSCAVGPLVPRRVMHRLNLWRNGPGFALKNAVVNPELARRLRLEEWLNSTVASPAWTMNPDARAGRCDVLKPGAYSPSARSLIDSAYGLESRDPALDIRIMEFCLGIPDRLYAHAGERRLLIRRAMRDLLPDLVLENRTRELQSADIAYRLKEIIPELKTSLERVTTSPVCNYYLNTRKMRETLDRLADHRPLDADTNRDSAQILLRGLVAGEYLRATEDTSR